jgi:hypothetical protein
MTITNYRQPRAGQYGTAIIDQSVPFPTIAGTATTTVPLGQLLRNQVFVQGYVSQLTLVVPTSGACTVLIKKWSVASAAFVPLTAATDLTTTGQVLKVNNTIAAIATLTDAQRMINAGDTMWADFTAAGAITTQPTGGSVGYEADLI